MATFIKNGFNIGPDASASLIYVPTGLAIPAETLGHLMTISAEQAVDTLKIEPITDGGRSVNQNIYTGWSGSLTWTRANGSLTAILSALEQNYYAGLRTHFDLSVSVSNIDGTLDGYLFHQVSLNKGQFGEFRTRNPVEQSIGFEARTMVVTSGPNPLIALV